MITGELYFLKHGLLHIVRLVRYTYDIWGIKDKEIYGPVCWGLCILFKGSHYLGERHCAHWNNGTFSHLTVYSCPFNVVINDGFHNFLKPWKKKQKKKTVEASQFG